jgi:hypothetical protein
MVAFITAAAHGMGLTSRLFFPNKRVCALLVSMVDIRLTKVLDDGAKAVADIGR